MESCFEVYHNGMDTYVYAKYPEEVTEDEKLLYLKLLWDELSDKEKYKFKSMMSKMYCSRDAD